MRNLFKFYFYYSDKNKTRYLVKLSPHTLINKFTVPSFQDLDLISKKFLNPFLGVFLKNGLKLKIFKYLNFFLVFFFNLLKNYDKQLCEANELFFFLVKNNSLLNFVNILVSYYEKFNFFYKIFLSETDINSKKRRNLKYKFKSFYLKGIQKIKFFFFFFKFFLKKYSQHQFKFFFKFFFSDMFLNFKNSLFYKKKVLYIKSFILNKKNV